MGDPLVPRKEGLFKRWFRTHVNKGSRKYDEDALNNLRNEISRAGGWLRAYGTGATVGFSSAELCLYNRLIFQYDNKNLPGVEKEWQKKIVSEKKILPHLLQTCEFLDFDWSEEKYREKMSNNIPIIFRHGATQLAEGKVDRWAIPSFLRWNLDQEPQEPLNGLDSSNFHIATRDTAIANTGDDELEVCLFYKTQTQQVQNLVKNDNLPPHPFYLLTKGLFTYYGVLQQGELLAISEGTPYISNLSQSSTQTWEITGVPSPIQSPILPSRPDPAADLPTWDTPVKKAKIDEFEEQKPLQEPEEVRESPMKQEDYAMYKTRDVFPTLPRIPKKINRV